MKKLILIGLLVCLTSCITNDYNTCETKVIKYKGINNIKYDWFDTYKPVGSYMQYIKYNFPKYATNYIYGPFEIISYEQYERETR